MAVAAILDFAKRLSFLNESQLHLAGILRLCYRIHTWNRKGLVTKIQHGVRRHLDCEEVFLFLFHLTDYRQI